MNSQQNQPVNFISPATIKGLYCGAACVALGIAGWLYHPAVLLYLLSAVVAGPLSLYILQNGKLRVAFIGKPRESYSRYFWLAVFFGMPATFRIFQGPPSANLLFEMSILFQWLGTWFCSVLVSIAVLRWHRRAIPTI